VSGAAMMLGIGVGCYIGGIDYYYYNNRYGGYYYDNDAMIGTGIAFMTIGGIAMAVGIPMLTVGSVRTKKAGSMDVTLNVNSNGIGFGLTF
jgi:hypothetical protein